MCLPSELPARRFRKDIEALFGPGSDASRVSWSGTEENNVSMSSSPRKLVSIVTPSFNQAKFLEETLRSVYLQNYRPIQHIVIDGGSVDDSVAILDRCSKAFGGADYRLEWISERDQGMAHALGKGFGRATGEYVGWLNSDDVYFDRHVVETAARELENHTDADVVYGDVALISENSGLWMVWCFPNFRYERALRGYIIPQPTVFFRSPVVKRHPIGDLPVEGVDHAYWLEIGRDQRFRHVRRVQAADRDHRGRLTNAWSDSLEKKKKELRERYGRGYSPTLLDRIKDTLVRVLLRFRGSIYLARILFKKQLESEVAFPLWVDSRRKVIHRQFTMRIGHRPDLGPTPAGRRMHAGLAARERS